MLSGWAGCLHRPLSRLYRPGRSGRWYTATVRSTRLPGRHAPATMPYVIITVLVVDGTVARRTLAWWPDLAPRVPRPGRGIPWLERPWPGHGRIASTVARVTTHVIVLNGGSSSGESGIARCPQAGLPDPWLAVGVDMLIRSEERRVGKECRSRW